MRLYAVIPFGQFRIWSILWLPVVFALYPLIVLNFELRRHGARPDEWYWADRATCWMGWCIYLRHFP